MKAPTDLERGWSREARDWTIELLSGLANGLPARFTGLGIVLYRAPLDIPIAPLAPADLVPHLPTDTIESAIDLLVELADYSNPLHDGFHLVEVPTFKVTHVCQFLSPPISKAAMPALPRTPIGARQMAAVLDSFMPCVVLSAVMSDRKRALIIERGRIDPIVIVPQ